MLAIIGGSGLTRLASLEVSRRQLVKTPYGEPSAALTFGRIGNRPVVFLARHGDEHSLPPHQVNYRANIWALAECSPIGIVSVAAVGSIRSDLAPGDLVIPHQIIDYTWGRHSTYHEGPDSPVRHVDFTEPYDQSLRRKLCDAATAIGLVVSDSAVYAATQGPRLETAAEVNRIERDGADVVGMTGMPEAILARELGVSYAAINVVANYAAGRGDSQAGISLDAIHQVLDGAMAQVRGLIEAMLTSDD
ncbi:MAG: S-methyl-5'-thioinosine phosphorylase [Candidatus Accumulibacter sp.]|uniref:Probable 6-oxopurine nucleoside phosphorylase n=1 Tax=Candidatus Accumulibacter proximus TaxID=2954385 RepID=A0A935UEW5_9PROT|nr:S-methyl-5'-thioinosine phosphorylase [Candidatus Accumulibacter proximus]